MKKVASNGFTWKYFAHSSSLGIFVFHIWIHLPFIEDGVISMNSSRKWDGMQNFGMTTWSFQMKNPHITPKTIWGTTGSSTWDQVEKELSFPFYRQQDFSWIIYLTLNVSPIWGVTPERPALMGQRRPSSPAAPLARAGITYPGLPQFLLWVCQSSACDN